MYKDGVTGNSSDFLTGKELSFEPHAPTVLQASGDRVELPDASFVRDAEMSREGMDLVLKAPDGSTVVIEGYFAAVPAPLLQAPDGSALTPELVQSFTAQPLQYADANGGNTATDESPVGAVQEVAGHATVTHLDGTVETIQIGTKIFQGDVIQTDDKGAVNIQFVDETTFAVSEDARLAIDEYVYDPSTQSGSTNFSVLKGVFVFTSGMIGREDPDDVKIETPVGSIGIRGTIIAGNVSTGEITVVEGAIVLKDFSGHEMTLASQFETARFNPASNQIEHIGQVPASQIIHNFSAIVPVSPQLFSSISDSAKEAAPADNGHNTQQNQQNQNGTGDNAQPGQNGTGEGQDAKPDQRGSADQPAPFNFANSGLTGDNSGLTGNSSGLSSETSGSSSSGSTSAAQAGANAGGGNPSAGSSANAGTGTGTGSGAASQQQSSANDQPPPEVLQQHSGGTNPATPAPNTPPQITGITGALSLAENTASVTEVARVQANSGDAGETLTYRLLSGGNYFDIASNGAITTKAGMAFDYETLQNISVQVEVSDGKDTASQTITIRVTDINEAPTALSLSYISVDENSAGGTVIGTLSTTDPDTASTTFTYSIVGDPDSKFAISGNQLVVNGALDYETATSHTVTVRTTDAGGLTHNQTFTIQVRDITESTNTAPTGGNLSTTINEDSSVTLSVSDFGFSDTDAGDTMAAIKIAGLPASGTLRLNGGIVSMGDTIGIADITAGRLIFQPDQDYNGTDVFSFYVQDNRGAFSTTANAFTITVTSDGINEIYGTSGNDNLAGTSGVDLIEGGDGNDIITGGYGNDTLYGQYGNDTFIVTDYDGNDIIDGGMGTDTYDASSLTGSITLDIGTNTATATAQTDTFANIEIFKLGSGADTATINTSGITLDTGAGNDTITINAQNATVSAGNDDDTIYIGASGSADYANVDAGDGNDTIRIDDITLNAHINGGTGTDILYLAVDGAAYTDANFATLSGVETINLDGNGGTSLEMTINTGMFAGNDTIVFNIDNEDALKLDFTAYDGIGSFALKSSGPNFREYYNLDEGTTIRIQNTSADWSNVITLGATQLDLDALVTSPASFAERGNIITDSLNASFGSTFAAVGDRDNDGHDDLLIGRENGSLLFRFTNPVLGGLTAPGAGTLSLSALSASSVDSMSYIGDFDGDGDADYIVGSSSAYTGMGKVIVVDESGAVVYSQTGNTGSGMGETVVGVGDVNGDGYADVLINSPGNGTNGQATLVYGGLTHNTYTLNGGNSFYGTDGYGGIGSAGDFDGDGKQDIVLTNAYGSSGTTGLVQIAFGGDLSINSSLRISGIPLDGEKDIPVFSLGDINGDGRNDIAIAAIGENGGKGAVHIVYSDGNRNSGAYAYADLVNHNIAGGGFSVDTAGTSYAIIGGGAVGDFNGDGIDDMALAFKIPGSSERDVELFVLYGGSDAMTDGNVTMEDLLNDHNAYHMTYTIPGTIADADDFEIEIGRAGDVNGDGLYDLAIGMSNVDTNPSTDTGGNSTPDDDKDGQVLIVYGQVSNDIALVSATDLAATTADTLNATSSGQTLMGGLGNDILNQSVSANSDLIMLGGGGNDSFYLYSANFGQIDGGSGNDMIKLLSSSATIDLTGFTGNDIARVETLNMYGSSQTLKINISTIMEMMNSSDAGDLSITASDTSSNLVIDTNAPSGNSQITSGSSNTASQVKLALEDVFGDGNVQYTHDTGGGAGGQGVDHFTIGGHTLSIDSALIDTIVVADV